MDNREYLLDLIPDEIHFKADQVAEIIDRAPKTIRKWCHKGLIISSNPGGQHRISGKELKRFLSENSDERERIRKSPLLYILGEMGYDDWFTKTKHTGQSMLLPEVFELLDDNKPYSTKKVSEYLGITPDQVRSFISKGELPSLTPKEKQNRMLGKDIKVFLYNRLLKKHTTLK